ncbi:MAG: phytoene desaturase family protein, partial [Lentisphaeria bacterium]
DRTILDLHPDPAIMYEELKKAGSNLEEAYYKFLDYSRAQYNLIEEGYFNQGLDTVAELLKYYGPQVFKLSFLTTMDRAVKKRLPNPYLRDIFDFFVKYVGSAATRAPGFMNLLPHIQFGYDLWYVKGGMYNLARGLERLLSELGVTINLNTEVTNITKVGSRVTGVETAVGHYPADWVVSNMEVIPAYKELLHEKSGFLNKLKKFEPACSGLVIHLGVDRIYGNLAHHNFFYSANQREHFNSVFKKRELPADPTLYVVAPSRTNPKVAPAEHDNLKILPHIPYLNEAHPYTRDDYMDLKDRVLQKLERMGLTDLRKHIVTEHVWTPHDIRRMYYSNGGSIYGVVSDIWKNYAFKAPKHSSKYDNLYFVGGSTNPGGGMPMVTMSGQLVAEEIGQRANKSKD